MEFRILGPLEVADGDNVITLASAKQRGLLAILLLSANEVVSADRLIDALWGEQGPESGRTALQVLVSKLRKGLGHAGLPLATRAPGYVVELERDQLDLRRFERLVEEASTAEPAVAAEKLREALALWRGPALADLAYESFAQPAIGRLEELRLGALEKRIDADLALGRDSDVVAELEELVAEHPLREGLRAQLMLALYRCGRQADALATYQTARRKLIEELGLEPSPPLRQLEQAILRQDSSLELASARTPQRSVLVIPLTESKVGALLALAAPLARRPPKELVVARPVDDRARLPSASAALHEQRTRLLAEGLAARAAVFVSSDPATDAVRMATELDCDLLLLDAPPTLLDSPLLQALLASTPCDVAALIGSEPSPGPLLVPFVGAAHDWTAIELAAWLAGAWNAPLRLAGPSLEGRDASRLLATASLVVQRALGVAAEPLLLAPEPDELLQAAQEAELVVAGLSDRWQKEGLGTTRAALAHLDRPPVLLVRHGLRPGGLAPRDSLTRFTWSVRPGQA
jgi:DNA-binding SARP family transcriptional activator